MNDQNNEKEKKKLKLEDVKEFSKKVDDGLEKVGDYVSEKRFFDKKTKIKLVATAVIVLLILFFVYPKTILIILGVFAGLNLSLILDKVSELLKKKDVKKEDVVIPTVIVEVKKEDPDLKK